MLGVQCIEWSISLLQLLLPSPFAPFLNFYQVSLLQLHFNLNSQDSSSSSAFDGIVDAQLFDDVCILKSVLSSTGELPCPHQRLLLQIQTVFMSLVHPSSLTFSASDCLQHSLSHLRCTSALNSRHLVFGSSSQPPPSGSIPSLSSVHLTTPNLLTGANRQRHRASPALCFRRKSCRQTRRFMSAEKVSPPPPQRCLRGFMLVVFLRRRYNDLAVELLVRTWGRCSQVTSYGRRLCFCHAGTPHPFLCPQAALSFWLTV